jgi:hypothetical protein
MTHCISGWRMAFSNVSRIRNPIILYFSATWLLL